MRTRPILPVFLAVAALSPRPARAALTDSEKAVVRTFIGKAVLDTAPRVRALMARPDLTADEVAEPLRRAFSDAPFDERHRRFTEALLFGPGSGASRNTLVPAVVDGLLSRAASRMADVPLEATTRVDKRARAASDEVSAIHAFIDSRIANAGSPPPDGHDASAGIREDALRACYDLYKAHLDSQERWLHARGAAAPELLQVRSQALLAVIDLGRGVVGRHEVSQALGLSGERLHLFERTGVLVEADAAPEDRLASAIRMLESAPQATEGLSLWLLSKASPKGLVARGQVVRSGVVLGGVLRPMDAESLWPEDLMPSSPDKSWAAVAASVAELATARAFASAPDLIQRARAASEHARDAGHAGYLAVDVTRQSLESAEGAVAPPTPASVIAAAVRLLLLDGARTIELAVIRASAGRAEPLEQLALALTVLGAGSPELPIGRTRDDGSVEAMHLTDVKTEGGLVTGFSVLGRRYAITQSADGMYTATVDGAAPKVTGLGAFRERTASGETFLAAGVEYQRLTGDPHAVGLDDGRLVVEGGKAGFDALATGGEVADVEVSARVTPAGQGGALLVRAQAGTAGYSGIGLVLETEAGQARLLWFDGKGKAVELGAPVDVPNVPPGGYAVSLKVVGDEVSGAVGDRLLSSTLPAPVAPGRVGIAVRARGKLDVRAFSITTKALMAKGSRTKRPPAKASR